MIVFDLRCEQAHGFEAWFPSSTAFETQRDEGKLTCPYCGSARIEKAMMAPRLSIGASDGESPATLLPKLAAIQRKMLAGSTWVGDSFAGKARAMADGAEPHATIHGTATPDDAQALRDDGVGVMPLIFPVVPPESQN